MKYLRYLIMTALVFSVASCDFTNPIEKLKPKKLEVKYENKLTEPMYKCVTPGIPISKRNRLGGIYAKYSPEEVADMVGKPIPPPDPRDEIKKWITLLAKIASGAGLLGLLIAAVLFVYQNPVWDDIAIVAAVAFSAGLTIAVSYNLITIVVPVLTLCVVCYFGYIIYNKHMKTKDTEKLTEAFDLISEMGDEGNKVQEALRKAGIVTERVENHVKKSLKKRNGTREKQIKQLQELLTEMGEA